MNKLDRFQSVVYSRDFDICCVTETWLNDSVTNNEIIPSNYQVYRMDRDSRGGGVMIAVKSSIPSRLINKHSSIEALSVEVDVKPKVTLTCMYQREVNKPNER